MSAAPAMAQQAPPKPAAAKPPATVGEVTVEGTAPPVRTSIDRKSYSVANDLQATTGSIGDALRNVPSVEVDVQGNVSLRGDANVTILVDGKPSGMFRGQGKAQALQSLPADQIERVEVITNPSAAFNPEGSAGIINLVMKKTAKPGVSGGVRANLGSAGWRNAGGNVSYRAGKLTLSGDAYLRHDSLRQSFTSERRFADPAGGGQAVETRRSGSQGTFSLASLRGGADYDLDPKTRLSAEARYQDMRFEIGSQDRLDRIGASGATALAYRTALVQRQARGQLELTARLHHAFGEGHEFDLSVTREVEDNDRSRPQLRSFTVPAATPAVFEDIEFRNRLGRSQIKADYARPLPGEAKLKLGYELAADDDEYRVVFGRAAAGSPIAIDPARSNLFRFDQQVHGIYATYERPFGKLTALAGFRAEATFIDLDQVTQALKSSNDYVRAYPSLHLSYRLDDDRQLTASYSRRVQRPNTQDYNAFRTYYDPQNLSQGNPDLKPQETDSFEAGYQHRKRGATFLATAYYRNGRNAVNDVSRDLGGGVILQTKANVGGFQSAGVELAATGRLPGRFTYNVSSNLLWSEIDARDLGFGAGRRSAYLLSGRGSLNWQATGNDFLQVQAVANGKTLLTQGYREPSYIVNLGYRHKFSDRLSGVVTAQDALGTARFASRIETAAYSERTRGEPHFKGVFLGLSYTFGGGRQRDTFDYGGGGGPPG